LSQQPTKITKNKLCNLRSRIAKLTKKKSLFSRLNSKRLAPLQIVPKPRHRVPSLVQDSHHHLRPYPCFQTPQFKPITSPNIIEDLLKQKHKNFSFFIFLHFYCCFMTNITFSRMMLRSLAIRSCFFPQYFLFPFFVLGF